MNKKLIYIHGQGGCACEAEHYKPLFADCEVIGFDYKAESPWEAEAEFPAFFDSVCGKNDTVLIVANSIGAFFAMSSLKGKPIERAYFISPVVDMEKLISDMMMWANVSEEELREKGEIDTSFGQKLSWEYLSYVRKNPIKWHIPTDILYGEKDNLTAFETVSAFAEKAGATLTVMKDGEHWFHTDEQMKFLDNWIKTARK